GGPPAERSGGAHMIDVRVGVDNGFDGCAGVLEPSADGLEIAPGIDHDGLAGFAVHHDRAVASERADRQGFDDHGAFFSTPSSAPNPAARTPFRAVRQPASSDGSGWPVTTPADTPAPPLLRAQRLVGEVLSDRYRIEALVGEGGMGAVYLAQHVLMRKRVAIKVLHPEMTSMPEIVARFEREAMAAAHIEHPNVAAATDFGKLKDGACFLVLEYVEGRNLRDVIADGPLPVALALHIASQIA